ncbi:MAG: EVE domain-containing protein [Pirellulales bacterium]|nr:EVE domain-containing protein [Pirellulales bacterium]
MPQQKPAGQCWLLKTEPGKFSIQDLAKSKNQTTFWNGVRNYQARNYLRDQLRPGDRVLLYHSNTEPNAVVGTATVVREGYPDHSAFDRGDRYFDPKSNREQPTWYMVDVKLVEIFPRAISLAELRGQPALAEMELLRRGSRLSVQPVRASEYAAIVKLAHSESAAPAIPAAPPAKTKRAPARATAGKAQRKTTTRRTK